MTLSKATKASMVLVLLLALGAGVTAITALASSTHASKPAWRDPQLFTSIKRAGQRVVEQKEVTVPANKPWVATGLSISPGARLWVDTRSDGKWSGNPRYFPYSDAKGLSVYPSQYKVDSKAPVLSLIGFVGGSPPTPREVLVKRGAPRKPGGGISSPGFFEAGDTLLNHLPKTTGRVWLRNNDNTNSISDVGHQTVRVILTTSR